ncbi:sensor histidine kinase [Silvimonas amylolytica]|uniref:Histidine kinase n=1 Tax=Silvimonas amylolytica TaxID=449663 RepID=A0ABQ2PGM1_9NEIS|nr:sensor histidine kinase [Silvimonas amylolytica]GGP24396.1 histidine kinase [Silvimonas amylolytica]
MTLSMRTKIWLLFLAALWLTLPDMACATPGATGQLDVVTHQSTAWRKRDGAPTGGPLIAQTPDGWMWFASDALYRFDGIHFERLHSAYGRPLQSSAIRSLTVIGDSLWVGYLFGGASRFSPHGSQDYTSKDGMPYGTVADIEQGPDGAIYAAAGYGLARLDGRRWTHIWPEDKEPRRALAIASDSHNRLWVETDYGLVVREAGSAHFSAPMSGLAGMAVSPGGTLWATDQKTGRAVRYDDTQGRFVSFDRADNPGNVLGVWFHRDGRIILQDHDGLGVYDQTLTRREPLTVKTQGANLQRMMRVFEDREANLWLGTRSGIERIRANKITQITLPANVAMPSAIADADGSIWVPSVSSSPLLHVQPDGHYTSDKAIDATAGTRTPDGAIWLGGRHRLWRHLGNTWQSWPTPAECAGRWPFTMTPAGDNGVWLSFLQRGLYLFRDGKWLKKGGNPDITGPTPTALREDGRHRLWIGYPDNHIGLVDGRSYRTFGPESGINPGVVLSIYERNGITWVGQDHGLVYFQNDVPHHLRGNDGKEFQDTFGIVQRENGELWLLGHDGLTRIATAELEHAISNGLEEVPYERFDYEHGLEGETTALQGNPSLIEAPDGRLWYATEEGIGWIDPDHIARNPLAPAVEVTTLVVGNKRWSAATAPTLPTDPATLQISYTGLSQRIPERMHFKYRLEGVDQNWVDAGARREAFYTNLPPGRYRFEIIAANEDNVWNTTGASAQFEVPPTFLETRLFRGLCLLALLAALCALYLWRVRQISERVRERTEVRIAERERIARGLHDTLLQSMQGTILRFQALRQRLEPRLADEFEHVLQQADAAMAEGRDRVMDLRSAAECPEDLPGVLLQLGEAMASVHELPFNLSMTGSSYLRLLPTLRSEGYAIVREALINAFNHADATQIQLDIHFGDTALGFAVRDNGKGIDATTVVHGRPGHWGLQGMRERASQLGGSLEIRCPITGGTEIALTIPAQLAYVKPPRQLNWRALFQRPAATTPTERTTQD